VHGTTSVLNSILKYGCAWLALSSPHHILIPIPSVCSTSVKRVIVTSSCAAVLHVSPEPKTFSEKDWNEQAPKEVEELGRGAQVMQKYRASKTLAERAAWDLWHANKDKVQWDLVTLNPPFVSSGSLGG
jgi:nucleoside-diphosphate-sugar epimerase